MRVEVTYYSKKHSQIAQSHILIDSTDSILASLGNKTEEFLHGYSIKVAEGKLLSIFMKKVH